MRQEKMPPPLLVTGLELKVVGMLEALEVESLVNWGGTQRSCAPQHIQPCL